MAPPAEIRHPTFGTLRLAADGGFYANYSGEVWLTPTLRVVLEIELDTDEKPLGDGLEAARLGYERFLRQEPENRLRAAQLLLPEVHHFFSDSYTAEQVAERLSLAELFLNESGRGTARYDSGGKFKAGTIAAHFGDDGAVEEVDDLN